LQHTGPYKKMHGQEINEQTKMDKDTGHGHGHRQRHEHGQGRGHGHGQVKGQS
jgi:hypothetical protein